MAENETLSPDSRSARLRHLIGERLDDGVPPMEVFLQIEKRFYHCLQGIWKRWERYGIDPCQLFEAALGDPVKLGELIRQTRFDADARLLGDVAASLSVKSPEGFIRAFLEAAWGRARGQHGLDRRADSLPAEFWEQIEAMRGRMLRGLLRNASKFPSRPKRKGPRPGVSTTLDRRLA